MDLKSGLLRAASDLRRAHSKMTKGLAQAVNPGAKDHYRTMRTEIGERIGEIEAELARLAGPVEEEGEEDDLSFLC